MTVSCVAAVLLALAQTPPSELRIVWDLHPTTADEPFLDWLQAGGWCWGIEVPANAADADFDRVKYRYEWKAGGRSARDVTIGAMGDYLPVDKGDAGGEITCSVKAFDGTAWSAPVVARSQ